MRYLNNIATVLFAAALGQAVLTSCEGGDLYNVDSPDWIASRVDSIAAEKQKNQSSDEIVGLNEDVYTIGATDYTSGWWAQFSKDYPIMENEMWVAQFNLNINPSASNTYKNFALIITSDAHRGDAGYKEYGAIRFDHQPSGNSEWGDYINRDLVESTLTFGSDTDAGVDKLGGKVTLYIDRSIPGKFGVKMTNGNVTKTYIQNYELENLNDDPSNTTIRAFLVVEGSYINFIGSTLEPIGGYTSAEDKQPLSMELKNMPKKILLGTSIDDAFANLGALVNFETGVSKEVKKEDLTFSIIPDMETVGQKQIIVAYNKTFKGENCDKPVLLAVNFEVVDKMYTTLGATDNTTPFFGVTTDITKVAPNETFITQFTNYTDGAANWDNFIVALVNGTNDHEYAVLRADCWGWGDGWDATTVTGHPADWAVWLADMDGAKVTLYVTNNGDGTADIKADMKAINGNEYSFLYAGINTIDPENMYFKLTLEKAHLEFDSVIGADNNTTPFFGETSDVFSVPAGKTVSTRFTNYTDGAANWDNFIVALVNGANDHEYAVLRADCWGWGDGWEATTVTGHPGDWGVWLADMDEAKVTLHITNNGDGTADVKADIKAANGNEYSFLYAGVNTINAEDLSFKLTLEKAHLVIE